MVSWQLPDPGGESEDLLGLAGLVAGLPEREIVVMRFVQELSQGAIAARIGSSQLQVSRLLGRVLVRLRAQLVEP